MANLAKAFVAYDAFSRCGSNDGRSVFQDAAEVTRLWGIRPRTEILNPNWSTELAFPVIEGSGPPWCSNSTQCINGGVPQAANISLQLQLIDQRIDSWIPDAEWAGHFAIDFELWTPVWDENSGSSPWHSKRYQEYSIALVAAAAPWLNQSATLAKAKLEF
jgi:hypothetical protein